MQKTPFLESAGTSHAGNKENYCVPHKWTDKITKQNL